MTRSRGAKSKGSAGDRLPVLDPQVQAGRKVVERALSNLKGWCAIATRYDEHARNFRAGVVIAGIVLFWPRGPSDTLLERAESRPGGGSDQPGLQRFPAALGQAPGERCGEEEERGEDHEHQ